MGKITSVTLAGTEKKMKTMSNKTLYIIVYKEHNTIEGTTDNPDKWLEEHNKERASQNELIESKEEFEFLPTTPHIYKEEKEAIAIIDLSFGTLTILEVPTNLDSEQTEELLREKGFDLSNCSWGAFDGEIRDERNDND